MNVVATENLVLLGIISGLLSCLIFLIFHHLTISNIWFSSPFMLLISGLSGYLLVRSYLVLFEEYHFWSWIGYNIYFTISLTLLSVASVLVFTPVYSSEAIINDTGGAPPSELITGSLPLTISWLILTAIVIVLFVNRSLKDIGIVLLTSAVLFLTLGLNISILGKVEIAPQHQYLVEKFMAMNIMLAVGYFGALPILNFFFSK